MKDHSRPVAACLACAAVAVPASTARTAASNLPAATANVARYNGFPAFKAPGPAFDGSKARGKRILVIPALPDAAMLPSVSKLVGGITQAAAAVGVKATTCANTGSDANWRSCFSKAIKAKPDAIVLAGGNAPGSVQYLVGRARSAGIAVIASHVPNPSDFSGEVAAAYAQAEQDLTAIVPAPYAEAGRLVADGVTVDRPTPAGRFVVIGFSDVPASAGLMQAIKNELGAVCGSVCPFDQMDVPLAQWQANGAAMVKNALLAFPTTVTFIPVFDRFGGIVAEGIRQARLVNAAATNSRLHSFGGSPFFIQMGEDNNRVEGVTCENMSWLGWATMDQTLRVLTSTPTLASEKTGLPWVDDDNWGTEGFGLYGIGFPPKLDEGWGDPCSDAGWITGYRKLWGLPADSSGPPVLPGSGAGD